MLYDKKNHLLYFLTWICSFIVVLYHYVWFFNIYEYQANSFLNYIIINQEYGANFVWLYWCISGYIFVSLLSENKIENFKNFFLKLFEKFYPLQLLTLIVITTLQYVSIKLFGYTQKNFEFDFYHFVLHIFFISDWGFQQGFSFNAPVWFMSILIPIYIFSYFFKKIILQKRIIFPLSIILITYFFIPFFYNNFLSKILLFKEIQLQALFNFGQCLIYFNLGIFIFTITNDYILTILRKKIFFIIFLNFFLIITSVYILNFEKDGFLKIIPSTIILFTNIIILFSILDYLTLFSFRKLNSLSNTSYSIYLWHFPYQVFLLIIFEYNNIDLKKFNSIYMFFIYIFSLFLIGYLSYFVFEKPSKKLIFNLIKKRIKN